VVKNWKHTRVDVFAARWGVSPATIKYLLKQRGLGLTWKQAIQLKDSPFLDPQKRRQWGNQIREYGRKRREQRRSQLVSDGREMLKRSPSSPRRRCVACQNIFPLNRDFFRATRHLGRTYYWHLCIVCSCERSGHRRNGDENLMVKRKRELLNTLRQRQREQGRHIEGRDCRKCFQSWPLDKRFFKYTTSKHTGRLLFDHVCRLCHAERRRRRARTLKVKAR